MRRLPLTGAILAVIAIYLVVSGCGGGSQTVQAADRSAPVVSIDHHLDEPATFGSPKVVRRPDGSFLARLSPAAGGGSAAGDTPAEVTLGGLGFPRTGEGFGQPYVGPAILSKWTGENDTYTVSLTTSARRVSAVVWNMGGRFQVRVGSTAVGVPKLIGTSNHHHDLDVTFPNSARRTITFALAGPVFFSGLRVGGGSTRVSSPTTPDPPPPSTYWIGDSYVAGGGSTHPGFDDLVHLASNQAGLTDVAVDALGGTGYVRTNTAANFPPYLTRARDNLGGSRARPQLIIVGGSINDAVFSKARVQRAASALYRYLARVLPSAHVIVVPFASSYPVPGAELAANAGIMAAAHAAPNVVGVLDLPERVDALSGAVAAKRRSGALDSKTVQGHPSEAGHELYGRIIGSYLVDCLRKLRSGDASRGICDQAS